MKYNQQGDIYEQYSLQDLKALQTVLSKEITKSIDIIDFIRSDVDGGGFQCAPNADAYQFRGGICWVGQECFSVLWL